MTDIALIQGHPDASAPHLCHALADAYRVGAGSAGHEVTELRVAQLDFPLIRSQRDFVDGERPDCILDAQKVIGNCRHLVIVYPLWLGTMPAAFKGFLEQVFRYDFAFEPQADGSYRRKLKGRTARIIVTMGMPALAYRWYFRAHSLKSLERNILRFAGISPVRETLVGSVDSLTPQQCARRLEAVRRLGKHAI